MAKSFRYNDEERRLWVLNDEGLYDLFKRSGQRNLTTWIKYNRKTIDEVMDNVVAGRKPGHYLKYGG